MSLSFRDRITRGLIAVSMAGIGGCRGLTVGDASSLFAPRLHRSEVVGLVAGFGTTFAAVPDLIKMFRQRSSQGINPTMAGIMALFQILWVYYGLLIGSRPVIVWNTIAVVINSLSVGAYLLFSRAERRRAGG